MNSLNFSGFNDHHKLAGCHALFGASKYHWINYDNDKILQYFMNFKSAEIGTKKHDLAKQLIELGVKLPHSTKTLNMYVNDAIGFHMTPEQVLYYSEYCFGTADAISFREGILRIHDLKTGSNPAKIEQLRIYAALFCLEYRISPFDIQIKLRIYQNNEVLYEDSDPAVIMSLCDKIRNCDTIIKEFKGGLDDA